MVRTLPDFLSSSSRAVFRVSAGGGAMRSTSSQCFSATRALHARKAVQDMIYIVYIVQHSCLLQGGTTARQNPT